MGLVHSSPSLCLCAEDSSSVLSGEQVDTCNQFIDSSFSVLRRGFLSHCLIFSSCTITWGVFLCGLKVYSFLGWECSSNGTVAA
jgi:hypothetical protein